ncbi:MAG: signal peptidase I [Planctomycetota bacterium]
MMRHPNPWFAAFLGLFGGPLGQIYVGRFRRGIVLWFIGLCLTGLLFVLVVSLDLIPPVLFLLAAAVVAYPVFLAVDAYAIARRVDDATGKWYQRWWGYVGMFLFIYSLNFLTATFVGKFIAEAFVVPGRAMVPTIRHMDRILVDKLWSIAETVRRNDVVVFRSAGKNSPLYVMRVLGLPGEVIEIKDRVVYINSEKADDIHASYDGEPPPMKGFSNFGPLTIPQDSFFVMGDNRFHSRDSRWLGPIPFADYCGHAKMIIWSRDYEFQDQYASSIGIPKGIRWDRIATKIR